MKDKKKMGHAINCIIVDKKNEIIEEAVPKLLKNILRKGGVDT